MALTQFLPTFIFISTTIHLSLCLKYEQYKYSHKNFQQWDIDLMGYEKDEHGQYPAVIGQKYGSIFLACKVNKIDPVKIQWYRNNRLITFPPPYALHWDKGSVLMVRPLIYGRTDGIYECIVSNGYVKLRKGINVTIREMNQLPEGFPQIIAHPGHVRTLRNNVDFHCIVSGKAPMKIVWFHNRVPLSESSAYNVSPTTNIGHKFSSNLMIKNVTKQTKGFYQCIAMNSVGHSVSKQGNIQFSGEKWGRRFIRSIFSSNDCLFPIVPNAGAKPMPVTVSCKFERTRNVYLDVIWPPSKSLSISKYVIMIQSGEFSRCWSYGHDDRRELLFDQGNGFQASRSEYNITVNALDNNQKVIQKGQVRSEKCPADINIHTLPNAPPLDAGSSFTFTCEYDGSPEPDSYHIFWLFSPDLQTCSNLGRLDNDSHVFISENRKTVTLVDVTKKQEGCYVCNVDNQVTEDQKRGYLRVNVKEKSDNVIAPTIGGVFGGLFLIVIFIVGYRYYFKPKPFLVDSVDYDTNIVYISHCMKSERNEMKLLKFADLLQKEFRIKIIMDLTSHIEINNAGGMFLWVPQAMQKANKIMVVLTKEYIETLKSTGDDEITCKVNAEYRNLNNMIYRDCYRSHRLVLITDGVSPAEFPDSLSGRSFFEFPKNLNATDLDVNRIVGVLYNQEMLQLQGADDVS